MGKPSPAIVVIASCADRGARFYQGLQERLKSAPGVSSASLAAVSILSGDEWDNYMLVEGHRAADGEDMQAFMNALLPGYFETMKIPLLEGRDFRLSDHKPNSNVAIVNKKFADHFFKGASAIGKHLASGGGPTAKFTIEIIGVVADSLYEGPREGVRRQVFIPHYGSSAATFYVRTTTPSATAFAMLRDEVRQMDAAMPIYGMKTVEGQLDETLLTERLIALLSAGFGFLATALASVGLYGVMAFVVVRRRKELGIRLALGAQPTLVIWLVMREVIVLLGIGLALSMFDYSFLNECTKPKAVIQAANDEYGGRAEVEKAVASMAEPKRLWVVDGATHLFPQHLGELEGAAGEAARWLLAERAG